MKRAHIVITFGQVNLLKATFNYNVYTYAKMLGILDYFYD